MQQGQIAYPGQQLGSANPPQSLNLQSGGIWQPTAGSYVTKLGPQSVLQWKDINSGLWRAVDSGPSSHPIPFTTDGTNFRVMNVSGTISGINVTVAGTLYSQATTTMSFAAPAAGTPSITAAATPIIGGSLSFTQTNGGTGYVNPIFLVPPPQLCGGTPGLCIPATIGSCTVTAGVMSAPAGGFAGAGYIVAPGANTLTITPAQYAANEQAYLNNTNIVIIDPAGSGAIITPAITNGTPTNGGLTGCIMTNPGAGYDGTHIPAVTIASSGSGINAAATSLPNMALKSITVGGTNTGYSTSVFIETTLGNGTAIAPIFDEPVMPRSARATATEAGGIVAAPNIDDAGNGFQTVPLAKQVGNATADGSVNATFTAVVGGVNNILIYWQIG